MSFSLRVCFATVYKQPNLKFKNRIFNFINGLPYYLTINTRTYFIPNVNPNLITNKCYKHSYISPCYIEFNDKFTKDEEESIVKNMIVIESFINESEENCLLNEIEPYMKRLRYEFSHWDNAIHGYRETEKLKWNEENAKIISRVRDFAFLPDSPQLSFVHILDLAEDGYIKPHIDAVRFCGNTIAGLSLLSDSVMRLVHDKDKTKIVDVLLKRRSLYVMRDIVRYDYTHEILAKSESKFKAQHVEKKRRISVICRNEPDPTVGEPKNNVKDN